MIERTRAANRSSDGPRSVTGPTALMSRAWPGRASRRAWSPSPAQPPSGGDLRWLSGELGHELGELVFGETQLVLAQLHQRTVRNVLRGGEVVHCRVQV